MAEANMLKKNFYTPGDLWQNAMELAAERDETLSEVLRKALTTYTASPSPCSDCGACDICGGEVLALDSFEDSPTATIMGYGRFDETTNPEVQALIDRARELLAVGAVGVSVALDLDPDALPADLDEVTEDDLKAAHVRIRHVAIVDTPAFAGAYLAVEPDGSLKGPMVFEGVNTGDIRAVGPVGTITLEDESLLPIPVIFDITDGDHTGTVTGHIDRWERVDGIVGKDVAPIAASISVDAYPSYLFAEPEATIPTVHPPDAHGYRRYSGIIADANVCHKGRPGGCYRYKAADLGYFHSGAQIGLDTGERIRVGPLMFGGLHADDKELNYAQALKNSNEDARTVFAMGRCFHHPKGLLFSGVLMPDADIMRIQATAPSIEQWPDHKGKLELKTALQVPRPALPFAASLDGGGIQLSEVTQPIVTEPHGDHHTRLDDLAARMERLEKAVTPLLSAHLTTMLSDD